MGLITEGALVWAAGMGDEDRDNKRAGALFRVWVLISIIYVPGGKPVTSMLFSTWGMFFIRCPSIVYILIVVGLASPSILITPDVGLG